MVENVKKALITSLKQLETGDIYESKCEEEIANSLRNDGYIVQRQKHTTDFSCYGIDQLVFNRNDGENLWEQIAGDTQPEERTYQKGRTVDLYIHNKHNKRALIEIKYINKYEISSNRDKGERSTFYNYLLGYEDKLDCKDYIPKNNRDANASPIYINKYGKRFLTFFHEGQIWWDIVKLLSNKEQCLQDDDIQLYSIGFMCKEHVIPHCHFSHHIIAGRLKKIIDTLKRFYDDQKEYRIIASYYNKNKAEERDSAIWIDYCSCNFTEIIDVFSVNDHFIAYVIQLIPCNGRTNGCT